MTQRAPYRADHVGSLLRPDAVHDARARYHADNLGPDGFHTCDELKAIEDEAVQGGLHQDVACDGRNGEGNVVNNGVYYLILRVKGNDGRTTTVKRKAGVMR